jgi:hypothetical protein
MSTPDTTFRQRFFARFMAADDERSHEAYKARKTDLLAKMTGRVLELGPGRRRLTQLTAHLRERREMKYAAMLVILVLAGCGKAPPPATPPVAGPQPQDIVVDNDARIKVGMPRETARELLGEPLHTQVFVKQGGGIFGVIENWWDDLAAGDKVEIWSYPDDQGRFSVYFLNDGDTVWHTSWVSNGIVF